MVIAVEVSVTVLMTVLNNYKSFACEKKEEGLTR
jgi:hypothetical protein